MEQQELKFSLAQRATKTQQLNTLVSWLKGKADWQSSSAITTALGLHSRTIRSLANQSDGLIISAQGTPGYKHITNCTIAELEMVMAKLDHATQELAKRVTAIRKRYHARHTA
ncbi:hypothetical protein ACFPK9_01050 [Rubritalea spongiae]|uniref:Uncharacterized protein n=1 Tax=Rubritalea spongiae TaxID=430797 RepID=A0ABW5E2C3_9BACT